MPEPLGPIKRIDGNVVRPLLRKTTEWRKMGIVMASRIAIARPRGEGFSRACSKSCMAAIMPRLQRFSWPKPSKGHGEFGCIIKCVSAEDGEARLRGK